jgi:asparagine synthase (glutamine-hydrolysing)
MTFFAGVLHREPGRSDRPAWLSELACSLAGTESLEQTTFGPFAGVQVGGEGMCHRMGPVWILASDLDLVNLDDVRRLTQSDDVLKGLASLYAREGIHGLGRLRGAFALALWDADRRELVLAVDQVGMHRLYYAVTSDGVAFGSRPGLLRGVPTLDGEPDPTAVYCYLNFGYVPAPMSITPAIRRVDPGCVVTVRDGVVAVERYWDASYEERSQDETVAAHGAMQLSSEAVARALGDGTSKNTGAFLSGGTDSSTILGLMTRLTGERIHAFSIGFQERRYDELEHAERAARHFGALHHVRRVSPADALEALPRLVDAYDDPLGNNSAIGTFLCAQLARENGMSRLLAGDGGDEIFGGNERYTTDGVFARYQRIPALLRRGLLEPALAALPEGEKTLIGRAQRYVRRANIPNPRRFYSYEFFFAQAGGDLLSRDFLSSVDPESPWRVLERHFERVRASEELNRLMYLDLKLTIGDNDLYKVTRTADQAGVEVRFPFLDLPLIELTGTWPVAFKVHHRGEKRVLFKRAFGELLPAATLRKQKHGFGVPTSQWLRTHAGFVELLHDSLLQADSHVRTYFRAGALDEIVRRHAVDSTAFYGDVLWNLLMLELWHRRHGPSRSAA